ncbi:MAG TPA: hypothetical protein PLK94_06295, partial [Alphaproteobacteria bacterium]|nr:hypothetical protein [Alphaproteobacteria bacterium]
MNSRVETQYSSVPNTEQLGRKSGLFSWAQKNQASKPNMWRSRLSWKIVMAVFLTIMTVQATLMALTLKSYQEEQLY